jgi:hypothetical protein
MTSCDVQTAKVDADGIFVVVFPSSTIAKGDWPHKLVGRAPDGHPVVTSKFTLATPELMEAAEVPTPGATCR